MSRQSKGLPALVKLSLMLTIVVQSQSPAGADAYFDEGVKRFNKKDFKGAVSYFERSLQNAPWDSSAFYYCALSYQHLNDWERAKEKYRVIVDRFPGTQACANATAVLKKVDPGYLNRPAAGSEPTQSATTAAPDPRSNDPLAAVEVTGPMRSKVQFQREGERVIVDAAINNRAVKMMIGSGDETVISKAQARLLGISLPTSAPVRDAGQSTPGWKVPVSIKVGEIVERNYPLSVRENADMPSLGMSFFKKVAYTMDNQTSSLVLTRKAESAHAGSTARGGGLASGFEVPFKREGKNMLVDVTVNGRRVTMAFEPGSSEVSIPRKRAREFGLDVQEAEKMNMYSDSNPTGALRGEAGFGEVKKEAFSEASLRMGPISKSGVRVKLDDETGATPSLGLAFFGDWRYTIDQSANIIRFHK